MRYVCSVLDAVSLCLDSYEGVDMSPVVHFYLSFISLCALKVIVSSLLLSAGSGQKLVGRQLGDSFLGRGIGFQENSFLIAFLCSSSV